MTKKRFVTTLILTCFTLTCALSACNTTTPPLHVHDFGEWIETKEATCIEDGVEERFCDCSEKETRPITKLGHDFGAFTKTATEHYKKCSRCEVTTERASHEFSATNACTACGYELSYTKTLKYNEIFADDETTVIGYAVAGIEEGSDMPAEITVPAYHENLPVTAIAPAAFLAAADAPNTTLKKVALPDGLTEIGYNAFTHCTALADINFDNVAVIGQSSFWNTGLTEITLKGVEKTVGNYGFYACPELETVTIECGVTLGTYALYGSLKLEKATVNAPVAVGKYAFGGNTALTEVEFGKNAEVTIDSDLYVFYGNTALTKITVDSNSVVIGDEAFWECTENSIDFIYGDNVTEIPLGATGESQFISNDVIKSVTIGKNVKKIGERAFNSLTNLTSITVPEGVTEIGNLAFNNCNAVKEVTLPKSLTKIGGGAFTLKSVEKVYYGGTIDDWCKIDFFNSLANPVKCDTSGYTDRVLYIGGKAVEGTVEINVTEISPYAFEGYKHLTALVLGEKVTKIGQEAFKANTSLERVVIKGKTLTVAALAFNNSTNLSEIYYCGTMAEMIEGVQAGGLLPDGSKYEKIWWFENKTHYFLSETGNEEPPAKDGYNWTFGGYFHLDGSGNISVPLNQVS